MDVLGINGRVAAQYPVDIWKYSGGQGKMVVLNKKRMIKPFWSVLALSYNTLARIEASSSLMLKLVPIEVLETMVYPHIDHSTHCYALMFTCRAFRDVYNIHPEIRMSHHWLLEVVDKYVEIRISYHWLLAVIHEYAHRVHEYVHSSGGIDLVKWANGYPLCLPLDDNACRGAAKGGHLELLKFLKSSGCELKDHIHDSATIGGHLEVIKWLSKNGCPRSLHTSSTCFNAAKYGHLEVLKWARENGCQWDRYTCHVAARNGFLEVLKWARKNGCPWDEITCVSAIHGGHLDLLKWIRSAGCPWDERTCLNAAITMGHLDVFIEICEGK